MNAVSGAIEAILHHMSFLDLGCNSYDAVDAVANVDFIMGVIFLHFI